MNVEEIREMLVSVFSSINGKKFDKFLRQICMADRTVYDDNPYRMAFNEGKRSVYLTIKNLMEVKHGRRSDHATK